MNVKVKLHLTFPFLRSIYTKPERSCWAGKFCIFGLDFLFCLLWAISAAAANAALDEEQPGATGGGQMDRRVYGYSTNLCHPWGTTVRRGWKCEREGFCMFRKKLNLIKGVQYFYWLSKCHKLSLPRFLCKHRYTSKSTICVCVELGEMT